MRFFNILCMLVLFQFCSHSDTITDYYVDKNANGNNNGTSWSNAWESFSDIEWNQIQPGDIIYISGGTDSTVYNEQLEIQASGTADNHISIRNSYDAGHNGRVIIDIVDYSTDALIIGTSASEHPDYIYIKGLEIRRGKHGVHIRWACEVITLDSLIITDNSLRGIRFAGKDSNGYTTAGFCADSLFLINTTIITPNDLNSETDVIYVQDASHIYIENNFMHCRNKSPINNHSDVIQSNRTRGWRIINNILISDSNAQGMPIIIGAWDTEGDESVDSVIIYNNYMYMGGLWYASPPQVAGMNTGWNSYYSDYGDMPITVVAHNTVVVHGPEVAGIHVQFPVTLFVNNILAQYGDGVTGDSYLRVYKTSPTGIADSIRNNLMWSEWEPGVGGGFRVQGYVSGNGNSGQCYDWNTWVNTYGGTGVNANPLFVDNIGHIPSDEQGDLDGELQAGSPAINQGEDIQWLIESMGLPWEDINGNPRDSTPDIGAYQYVP